MDLANHQTLRCVLTSQPKVQLFTAIYFLLMDVVTLAQYFYYAWRVRSSTRAQSLLHDTATDDTPQDPNNTGADGQLAHRAADDKPATTVTTTVGYGSTCENAASSSSSSSSAPVSHPLAAPPAPPVSPPPPPTCYSPVAPRSSFRRLVVQSAQEGDDNLPGSGSRRGNTARKSAPAANPTPLVSRPGLATLARLVVLGLSLWRLAAWLLLLQTTNASEPPFSRSPSSSSSAAPSPRVFGGHGRRLLEVDPVPEEEICGVDPASIPDAQLVVGNICAWLSGLLYFASRFPQIFRNYARWVSPSVRRPVCVHACMHACMGVCMSARRETVPVHAAVLCWVISAFVFFFVG